MSKPRTGPQISVEVPRGCRCCHPLRKARGWNRSSAMDKCYSFTQVGSLYSEVDPGPLVGERRMIEGQLVRVLTIIPAYNEAESLPGTLQRLRAAVPESDVLVVDDNSPDGTGVWADAQAAKDEQVFVLQDRK